MAVIYSLSEDIDTEFTHTWYEIRAEAIDNILDAIPIFALLKAKNRFKPQVGGRFIERTIGYGEYSSAGFSKGSTLSLQNPELETVALFDWAYTESAITRSMVDDQINAGPSKIKDYVKTRLMAARNALVKKIEDVIMAETIFAAVNKDPLSLYDYIPDTSSTDRFVSTETYGKIPRDNVWWQHQDYTRSAGTENQFGTKTGPASITLYDDMKNVYNSISAQLNPPDIIITSQNVFELFEDFAVQKEQIIRDETTRLADLGFDVLRFRGKPITWTTKLNSGNTQDQMIFINSEFLDVVFDPNMWFDMTDWQRPQRQLESVAYIILAWQILGYNPRFNGRIKWDSL